MESGHEAIIPANKVFSGDKSLFGLRRQNNAVFQFLVGFNSATKIEPLDI